METPKLTLFQLYCRRQEFPSFRRGAHRWVRSNDAWRASQLRRPQSLLPRPRQHQDPSVRIYHRRTFSWRANLKYKSQSASTIRLPSPNLYLERKYSYTFWVKNFLHALLKKKKWTVLYSGLRLSCTTHTWVNEPLVSTISWVASIWSIRVPVMSYQQSRWSADH